MNGFISYAHDDYDMFTKFNIHLRSVGRAFGISFWSDQRLDAGYLWEPTILRQIDAADVFVLLVSPAFIASDYIYDREIPAIRQRRHSASALVLPVVLQRCYWELVCDALQAAPTDHGRLKPIADWTRPADGFDRARQQIVDAVQNYYRISSTPIKWRSP
jgi:hypothetical protein